MARVKVTINKKGHIPQLGLGPIRRPVLITEELCDHLIKLGYPVKIIENPSVKKKVEKKDVIVPITHVVYTEDVIKEVVEQHEEERHESSETVVTESAVEVQEEPAVVVEEQPVIETEEEKVVVTEEDVTEGILMDDPDLSADAFYTENFLTSKALCKKILSNRQVQYEDSATFVLLKRLVLDSNPEVEFVEETVEEVPTEE